MNTSGDWIGWGVLVCLIGGVAAGAAWRVTDEPYAAVVAIPVGAVGGALVLVGLIGWGVSLGLRHAEETRRTHSSEQSRQGTSEPGRPIKGEGSATRNSNLPSWDQTEARGYR